MFDAPVMGVSDFVASLNQTFELAYPYIEVRGELSNFRISKNKWVYFDLIDEEAQLKCFATVYSLPGPLEDGMVVQTGGVPRLHPRYNFSFQVQSIMQVGEGALKRSAELLAAKLEAEGLFNAERKRALPYPPRRAALLTAADSAAYADFVKVASARWPFLEIVHHPVLVQGAEAPSEIAAALRTANESADACDVIVLVRGGGSAEDLAAWNDERVVRAIAASRIPTLAAIGHETDISLAELAADVRASTPSNAAELLVPDVRSEGRHLAGLSDRLDEALAARRAGVQQVLASYSQQLDLALAAVYGAVSVRVEHAGSLLAALDPSRLLAQGYAVVRSGGHVVTRAAQLTRGQAVEVQFTDGAAESRVNRVIIDKADKEKS